MDIYYIYICRWTAILFYKWLQGIYQIVFPPLVIPLNVGSSLACYVPVVAGYILYIILKCLADCMWFCRTLLNHHPHSHHGARLIPSNPFTLKRQNSPSETQKFEYILFVSRYSIEIKKDCGCSLGLMRGSSVSLASGWWPEAARFSAASNHHSLTLAGQNHAPNWAGPREAPGARIITGSKGPGPVTF